MSAIEIFERFCCNAGVGKRLDIENYPDVPAYPVYEHTRRIAGELIQSARQQLPELPGIHLDFVETPNINAFACKSEGQYLIGITAGSVLMLHLVIDHIMASPKTFPNIGDAASEAENSDPVPWEVLDASELFDRGIRPIGAEDESRVIYGKALADQALMFLLGHEIAHITRGHVDYAASSNGLAFISELSWDGKHSSSLERQALEADADMRTVGARCHSMYMTANRNAGVTPAWSTKPVTAQHFQYDWLFAANVLFRLFGDKRFSKTDLDATMYPPWPIRRRIAMDHAANTLLRHWAEGTKELISETVMGAVKTSEFSFAAIGAPPPEGGFADAFNEESTSHIRKIGQCYQDLLPGLQKHSYEPLNG
jgi:hypothetical protein